jgi:hypothetical protein
MAAVADATGCSLARVPLIAAISVVGAVACRWRLGAVVGSSNGKRGARFPGWACVLIVLPVAALHLFLSFEAFTRLPCECDGLRYHLPMVVRWVQDGRLSVVREVWQYCCPSNGELWLYLFAATGMESSIVPAMIPLGVLTALCTAGVARELGATTRGATVTGVLILASPMLALQMHSSYVDLFSVAFMMASLYWVLRLARCGASARAALSAALLAGLSLGIGLGSKLGMLVWAVPIVLTMLAAVWRAERHVPRLAVVMLFAVGTLVCSSYWYVRSQREMGWFLHPICMQIGPWRLGSGCTPAELCTDLRRIGWRSLAYPWTETKKSGYPYTVDNGVGPIFVAFAVAGTLHLIARQRRRRGRSFARVAVVASMVVGVFLFVEVCFSYPRYAMGLWVLMFAAAGPILDLLLRRWFRSTVCLTSLCISLSCAMIALWPAKTLVGRWRDSRAGLEVDRGVPALVGQFAPGTVILNVNDDVANYALLGPKWTNAVVETTLASSLGIRDPITSRQLADLDVDMVWHRGKGPPPFAADVDYVKIYDQAESCAAGSATPARMYRVKGVKTSASNPAECRWDRR